LESVNLVIDFVMHLDKYLDLIIQKYGVWTYAILFCIIFLETGFVVTPFLPGDSLLFACGTFSAIGSLHLGWLIALLSAAAVLGDTVNYWIGHAVGPKAFSKEKSRLLNKNHLERTRVFYEKYGGKTIVIARFVPIIRTFAPFVAGIGSMSYGRFLIFNVTGGIAWVAILSFGGYFFGNIPLIRGNFSFVIFAIIIISVLPAVIEVLRQRNHGRT
jgi:membrane-associated protein